MSVLDNIQDRINELNELMDGFIDVDKYEYFIAGATPRPYRLPTECEYLLDGLWYPETDAPELWETLTRRWMSTGDADWYIDLDTEGLAYYNSLKD